MTKQTYHINIAGWCGHPTHPGEPVHLVHDTFGTDCPDCLSLPIWSKMCLTSVFARTLLLIEMSLVACPVEVTLKRTGKHTLNIQWPTLNNVGLVIIMAHTPDEGAINVVMRSHCAQLDSIRSEIHRLSWERPTGDRSPIDRVALSRTLNLDTWMTGIQKRLMLLAPFQRWEPWVP